MRIFWSDKPHTNHATLVGSGNVWYLDLAVVSVNVNEDNGVIIHSLLNGFTANSNTGTVESIAFTIPSMELAASVNIGAAQTRIIDLVRMFIQAPYMWVQDSRINASVPLRVTHKDKPAWTQVENVPQWKSVRLSLAGRVMRLDRGN